MSPKTVSKKVETPEVEHEDGKISTQYEIMLILDPDVNETQYKKNYSEVRKSIEGSGGSIWHEEEWGKRSLAYEMKKKSYGYYMIFNFEMAPEKINEVNHHFRITPFVVRHLIVKTPKGYAPQKYNLDEPKPQKLEMKEKPKATYKSKPEIKRMEEREMPKDTIKETPKMPLKPAPTKEDLSKLDEKLEEILSDDMNL